MPQYFDSSFILHSRGDNLSTMQVVYQDTAADTKYYAYEGQDGYWLIQKFVLSTGTYTYASGQSDVATNWGIRAALTYGLYSALFA